MPYSGWADLYSSGVITRSPEGPTGGGDGWGGWPCGIPPGGTGEGLWGVFTSGKELKVRGPRYCSSALLYSLPSP